MNASGEHDWQKAIAAQGKLLGKHQQHLAELDAKINLIL